MYAPPGFSFPLQKLHCSGSVRIWISRTPFHSGFPLFCWTFYPVQNYHRIAPVSRCMMTYWLSLALMRAQRSSSLGNVPFLSGATLIFAVKRVTVNSPFAGITHVGSGAVCPFTLTLKTWTSFFTGAIVSLTTLDNTWEFLFFWWEVILCTTASKAATDPQLSQCPMSSHVSTFFGKAFYSAFYFISNSNKDARSRLQHSSFCVFYVFFSIKLLKSNTKSSYSVLHVWSQSKNF